MTLDEKVSQMMNEAVAIPRLGIPRYGWWNEGLHGVARSGYATMFPQAIGMAATWDTSLVGQIGETIATEARAKYNNAIAGDHRAQYYGLTFWSPNINIFRDPRWGRGQETYGEDPYLTGRLGVAFVKGLQGDDPLHFKTIATPKHFAVHSGPESSRHRFNVTPSPHDLEDTYLPAFRATITEAHADSLMCAYNAIDGAPACANKELLQNTLRDQWGFKGFVTSDCGAIDDFFEGHKTSPDAAHASAAAVLAGTDTNCGNTYRALPQAVRDKLLPESAIDTAVKRLFTARFQLGMFDGAEGFYAHIPFSENDSPAHQAAALAAAKEAMVLLKNEHGTLPLKATVGTIAVIGPNAASLLALEGNYNAIASHPVLPVDGIITAFPSSRVIYAQGSPYTEDIELPAPRTLFHTADGHQGLTGEYFANAQDASATPVLTRIDSQIDFDWSSASPAPGLKQEGFMVRWSGTITALKAGVYQFGIKIGRCGDCQDHSAAEGLRVTVDGQPVELTKHTPGPDGWDFITPQFDLIFTDTKAHLIAIEYQHLNSRTAAGISLRWKAPVTTELDEAVAAAQKSDVVVAFVGLNSELEGEEMPVHVEGFAGGDRTSIELPRVQQHMLEAVSAAGKPIVVVLMNGSALSVNWAQAHADAMLEAWYPGQAGGTAIAATLAGQSNPGGKLPITFYASTDQLPAFDNYAMKGRTYRYFAGKPLYGFGYGLSYTQFAFTQMRLDKNDVNAGDNVVVEAELQNTGAMAGDEVAELYLTPPKNDVSPRLALTAFERVHLQPGESKHVRFTLSPRQLSQVDAQGHRAMMPGTYTLSLGGGQPIEDKSVTARFTIHGARELPR